MPKFFVVSDVHGYYDELMAALDKAGFDKENLNHWLIGCGDFFDRGKQPAKVMNFFLSLPRKVLIRGNHEDLFQECLTRGYWMMHDTNNGTYYTICDLGGAKFDRGFDDCCIIAENKTKFFLDSMVNYFETKNYIFVHGWIPVSNNDGLPKYYRHNRRFKFNPDWRSAHTSEWEQARWLNGMDMAREGFIEPNKTIVCGHWHCSYGHMLDSLETDDWISEFNEDAIWKPYCGEGVIAIDRCTAHTGEVNVLIIEDDFLEENMTDKERLVQLFHDKERVIGGKEFGIADYMYAGVAEYLIENGVTFTSTKVESENA